MKYNQSDGEWGLNARLWYLQCDNNGDTTVLQQAILAQGCGICNILDSVAILCFQSKQAIAQTQQYTLRPNYNMINSLQYIYNMFPISHLWRQGMGVFYEHTDIWYYFKNNLVMMKMRS